MIIPMVVKVMIHLRKSVRISKMVAMNWYICHRCWHELRSCIDLKLETAYLQGTTPIYNNGYDNGVRNFENVTMLGTTDVEIIGDDDDNILTGGSGNDIIRTGAGNDQLFGGLGDDILVLSGQALLH